MTIHKCNVIAFLPQNVKKIINSRNMKFDNFMMGCMARQNYFTNSERSRTFISSHLSPLISVLVGTPQMMLQQYRPTFPCLQSLFAVEYSFCFISVMNLDLYGRCFDPLMSRSPSRGPNFYVYMNQSRT